MTATYPKETFEIPRMIETPEIAKSTETFHAQSEGPPIHQDGSHRYIKKGENLECFYFQEAKKRIGDKWSLLVLFILRDGSLRFNELLRGVQGISQKVLSTTLRDLERDGYLSRQVMATTPPGVAYSLTAMGRGFLAVLGTLSTWIEHHWQEMEQSRQHFDQHTQPVKIGAPTWP
jgi:DNA-binding HxlR family transcriptional regulator